MLIALMQPCSNLCDVHKFACAHLQTEVQTDVKGDTQINANVNFIRAVLHNAVKVTAKTNTY